jgi:hypothetical protein
MQGEYAEDFKASVGILEEGLPVNQPADFSMGFLFVELCLSDRSGFGNPH